MTFVTAIVLGLAWGRARRPSAPLVAAPPLWWLLLVAAAVQFGVAALPSSLRADLAWPGVVTTNLLVGTCFVVNAMKAAPLAQAFRLALVGWILNVVVVVANRGMPVSLTAVDQAGFPDGTDVADGFLYEHVAMTSDTNLRWLGDVIAVPAGPLREVVSVGDLVLALGIAVAVGVLTGRRIGGSHTTRDRKEVTHP